MARRRLSKNDKRAHLFARPPGRAGKFAMIQPQMSARSTTAALRKVEDGLARPMSDDWQAQAYAYVDQIGEVGYTLGLKAHLVGRCRLVAQTWDPEVRRWVGTDDERALRVLTAFVGPDGSQGELLRRAALHLSIAGESLLLGTPAPGDATVETGLWWEFLSTEELRIVQGQKPQRRRAGTSGPAEEIDDDAYIARLWRPHPRFSDMPDSEMRRVLNLCAEVVVLGQYIDAVAKSSLPAGILFVPEEMSFVSDGDDEDEFTVDGDDIDKFSEDLIRHMSAPVEDPSSAARLVPLLLRGPGEKGELIRMIDIARSMDTFAADLRREALTRLARGLDVPPEVMTGKAAVAYWTSTSGQNMDLDFIDRHVLEPGRLITDFLTFAYFRPMLEVFEGLEPEETARFRLWLDPSPIMPRKDEGEAALKLWQLDPDLVSLEAVRSYTGLEETDRPDPEEVLQRRMWQLVSQHPEMFARALLPRIKGFEDVDPDQLGVPTRGEGSVAAAAPASAAPGSATSAREPEPAPLSAASSSLEVLAVRLGAAVDAAVKRALEVAGARVVGRSTGRPEIRDRIRTVRKADVLRQLRPADLRALKLTPDGVLNGAWDDLALTARSWITDWLVERGVDPVDADERAAMAASAMTQAIDAWMKEHLHASHGPGPNGLWVPDELITGALALLGDWADDGKPARAA